MESSCSRFRTLCAHEPRIAEFIPPQRRRVQEHRNNSNAFANVTLKRHECRAPFARFIGSPRSRFRALGAYEPEFHAPGLGMRCRAERIHRFSADTFHRCNPMCERSVQSKSGNVAGSVAALQDLAGDLTGSRGVSSQLLTQILPMNWKPNR